MNKEYLDEFVSKVVKLHNDNMMLRATIQRRDEKLAELYLMLEGYKIQNRDTYEVYEELDIETLIKLLESKQTKK
jgi:hypothetical protein